MRSLCLYLLLFLAVPASAESLTVGSLWLFRWNNGFRAENSPSAKVRITEREFVKLLSGGYLPNEIKNRIYPGCYLAHFRRKLNREIASTGPKKPISEMHRICVPHENKR